MIEIEKLTDPFKVGDLVLIAGIPGFHEVLSVPTWWEPPFSWVQVRLAPESRYGPWRSGDIAPVQALLCEAVSR